MKIIISLFSQILEMSVTAAIVIGVVLFIRILMGKLPKKYSYCLWAVVLFRLLCPVSVSSTLSLFNWGEYRLKRFWEVTDAGMAREAGMLPAETITTYTYPDAGTVTLHEYTSSSDFVPVEVGVPLWLQVSSVLWLVGIAAILFYSIFSYCKFRKLVEKATLLRENIYECENISSPFVMGILKPAIYIPYRLQVQEQEYILVHERYHIKRGDHIVKFVAFMVLSVYWFHPLVWVAFFFACRDMEMSCDEKVLSMLGGEIRQDYSMLLLAFATNKRMCFVGPLAFGESDTGKRVKNVLRFRKPHIWTSVLGIGLFAVVVLGCATDKAKEEVVELRVEEVAGVAGTDSNQETEYIILQDEINNASTGEAQTMSETEVTHHDYPNKVESAEPEELSFLHDWVTAFCNRDGEAISKMAAEESREMLGKTLFLEEQNGKYTFGWSSPWPVNANADWKITEVGNGKAVILYYAWTSDPHVTVWRSEVSYEKVNGEYRCIPEEIQVMERIDSVEDFYKAYPYAIIPNTRMDYLTNGMGEVLYENAEENRTVFPDYDKLYEPATAVKYLLNLSDNVNVRVRPYVESEEENRNAYIHVRLVFPDGYLMTIQMVSPFGEDGIWIPQAYLTEEETSAE